MARDADLIFPVVDGEIVRPPNVIGRWSHEQYMAYHRLGTQGISSFVQLSTALEEAFFRVPAYLGDRSVMRGLLRDMVARECSNMVFPRQVITEPVHDGRRSRHHFVVPELDLSVYLTYKFTVPVKYLLSVRRYFGAGLVCHIIDGQPKQVVIRGARDTPWISEIEHVDTDDITAYMEYCHAACLR